MTKRISPRELLRHAIETHDNELVAMIIAAGALEILLEPRVSEQPAPARAAVLATFALDQLQPVRVRA